MFLDLYRRVRSEKDSILCVGLDPAPENFAEEELIENPGETLLNFCLDIVEKTAHHTCAYKPNSQFLLFALDFKQLKILNRKIREAGCISILDHKLGDIGSSNKSAVYWIKKAEFDAFTFSPFAGNIREATSEAHKNRLGIFVLTRMSNPESQWIQKESEIRGMPVFKEIARRVRDNRSDGIVVGATDSVTKWDIREIRNIVEEDTVLLCPGVGAQGGDAEFIVTSIGENSLINVSRAIINEEHPSEKAKEYQDLFNRYR